jgi:hypothetical protein
MQCRHEAACVQHWEAQTHSLEVHARGMYSLNSLVFFFGG